MDEINGGELQGGEAGGYEHHALAAALDAFGSLSDVRWHAPILTLFALRSFCTSIEIVRLPLCLIPRETDQMLIRLLAKSLFNCTSIYVQAISSSSLAQLFADTDDTLLMDLTSAGEGIAPFTRRYAHARSIPGNSLALKSANIIYPAPVYGESVFILPDLDATYIGPNTVALDLAKNGTSPVVRIEVMTELKACLSMLARSMSVVIPEATLPAQEFMDGPTTLGFLVLLALARQADRACPRGRFEAAVHDAWIEMGDRVKQSIPASRRRALLCAHIVAYLESTADRPHPRDGWRLDLIAKHIRECDPEVFADFDQTALGKELSRLSIGKRCRGTYPGGATAPARIFCTRIVFSDADKTKLLEVARNELQA